MALQVINKKTVGSAGGRDFATIALWEAALAADLTTGDGRVEIGEVFADSIFAGATITGTVGDIMNGIYLMAAPGETPIVNATVTVISGPTNISGLTWDAVSSGFALEFNQTSGAGRLRANSCIFKNGTGLGGVRIRGATGVQMQACLAFDNQGPGFLGEATSATSYIMNGCGSYGNLGAEGKGFSSTLAANRRLLPFNCWAFANAVANYFIAGGGTESSIFVSGNHSDDSSLTDEYTGGFGNVVVAPGAVAAMFVDVAARNFDLSAASALKQIGVMGDLMTAKGWASDISRRAILFDVGQQGDIGPFQPSAVPAAVSGTPPGDAEITGVTAGNGQVTVAVTAADSGDKVIVRFRIIGQDWDASVAFFRTGSGDVIITGLTNGTTYEFSAYAEDGTLTSITWAQPLQATPTDGSVIRPKMIDNLNPLQVALFARLDGDATLDALITGVFDHVPQGQPKPYITISDFDNAEWRTHSSPGHETTFTVHAWSEVRGNKELFDIRNEVVRLLGDEDQDVFTVVGFSLVGIWHEGDQIMKEVDSAKQVIRHAIIRFRIKMLQC